MELFQPEFGLMFWMLVVFLIILGILAKFAWPVIIRSIEQRAEFIDSGVKNAQLAQDELNNANAKIKSMLEEAHRKQLESLQETERLKQTLIDNARKEAAQEAKKVMEAAQLSIEQAKREAELQLRKQVSSLSLEIAGKVLREKLADDAEQVKLVNKMLDELRTN
ncbi:MAG: F0F1 ATP synthase subunit B [Odoribacter sp.]|nr:F0F1 ATP synthase subunit B [Odoribacter sp.]